MIGIAFTSVFSGISLINYNIQRNQFIETAETGYAIVDYIDVYETTDDDGTTTHYNAYCHYTVNGVTYNNIKITANSSTKEGDQFIIHYDPTDPSNYVTSTSASGNIAIYIFGGIFIFIGFIIFLPVLKFIIKLIIKLSAGIIIARKNKNVDNIYTNTTVGKFSSNSASIDDSKNNSSDFQFDGSFQSNNQNNSNRVSPFDKYKNN